MTPNCNVIVHDFMYRHVFPNEIIPPDFSVNMKTVEMHNPRLAGDTPAPNGGGENIVNSLVLLMDTDELPILEDNSILYNDNTFSNIPDSYDWENDPAKIIVNAIKYVNPDTPKECLPYGL